MRMLVAVVMMLVAGVAPAEDLLLFGGKNHDQFLGCVSCSEYHPNSINNDYGRFGSPYSPTSIRNEYGQYGSRYSSTSPWNQYGRDPPVVVDRAGRFYGYLTTNPYHSPGRSYQSAPVYNQPAPTYDDQAELERLAAISLRLYPNGVPQLAMPPIPQEPQREAPLLIDGAGFDPMALRSNQIAAAQRVPDASSVCGKRWVDAVDNIPENVSFDRYQRIVQIYTMDRNECIARGGD